MNFVTSKAGAEQAFVQKTGIKQNVIYGDFCIPLKCVRIHKNDFYNFGQT
jgi:hypothetical protein